MKRVWLRQKGDYVISKGLALFVTECGGMNADGPWGNDVLSPWGMTVKDIINID